jgi:ABC-2 type transport system ATP-binding protein
VIIINQGRIVASGTPAELRREFLGRATYRIDASGTHDQLAAALATVRPDLSLHALTGPDAGGFSDYEILCPESDEVGEALLRVLTRAEGVRIRALARTEATLEHVFLAATRRSWDITLDRKKQNPGSGYEPPPVRPA